MAKHQRLSNAKLLLGALKEEDENDVASGAEDEPTTASSDPAFSAAEGCESSEGDLPAGIALPPGLLYEPSDLLDSVVPDSLAEDPWWMLMHMVIIRGIPETRTPSTMLKEFEDAGFHHMLDFDIFIMPVDKLTGKHLGYGIVHFFSSLVKSSFSETFDGKDASEGLTFSVMPAKEDDMAMLLLGQAGPLPEKTQSVNFCPHCGARSGGTNFNFCTECGGGLGLDGRPPPQPPQAWEKEQQSLHQPLWDGGWNQLQMHWQQPSWPEQRWGY
eukprot:CAMPEP_0197656000 /NCGR_PEP_ID=MMETSP1338-20131121/39806_1 /TAXON_ID=43686 ORGANISM="Pelagodinium beii, Strain RCC1491" /NCGR_SAMPLE_ID=MMETSP1338 /ASSEMBLY_ACC=CAM_ASM_000754 /LENGTH=270 /DNA_ID=CAMNT_0043231779 /DNA_START=68 /DNA_END=880 /DNA_ORIENTATION=-